MLLSLAVNSQLGTRPGAPSRTCTAPGGGGVGEGTPQGRCDAPIFSLEKKAKPQHTQHATQIFVFILKRARVAGLEPKAHAWLSHAGSEGASPVPTRPTQLSFLAAPTLLLLEPPRVPTHRASAVLYPELARQLPPPASLRPLPLLPRPDSVPSLCRQHWNPWPPQNSSSEEAVLLYRTPVPCAISNIGGVPLLCVIS